MKVKYNMACDCCGWSWNAENPEHGLVCPDCGCYGTIAMNAPDTDSMIRASIDELSMAEAKDAQ